MNAGLMRSADARAAMGRNGSAAVFDEVDEDDDYLDVDHGRTRFLSVAAVESNDYSEDDVYGDERKAFSLSSSPLSSSSATSSSRRVRSYVQKQLLRRQRRRRVLFCAALLLLTAAIVVAVAATVVVGRRQNARGRGSDEEALTMTPNEEDEQDEGNTPVTTGTDPTDDNDNNNSSNSNYDDDKASAIATYENNDDDNDDDDDMAGASNAFVRPDPSALESYCGYSLTMVEGFQACETQCAHSACCRIPIGMDGSCIDLHAEDCQVYKLHCSVLDNKPSQQQQQQPSGTANSNLPVDDDHMTDDPSQQYKQIGPAPDDIDFVCSYEQMSLSIGHLKACASYCVNAYCCYDQSPYDCRDQQPYCARYEQPCTNLQNKLQEP